MICLYTHARTRVYIYTLDQLFIGGIYYNETAAAGSWWLARRMVI
jgi:hypothetical protein